MIDAMANIDRATRRAARSGPFFAVVLVAFALVGCQRDRVGHDFVGTWSGTYLDNRYGEGAITFVLEQGPHRVAGTWQATHGTASATGRVVRWNSPSESDQHTFELNPPCGPLEPVGEIVERERSQADVVTQVAPPGLIVGLRLDSAETTMYGSYENRYATCPPWYRGTMQFTRVPVEGPASQGHVP